MSQLAMLGLLVVHGPGGPCYYLMQSGEQVSTGLVADCDAEALAQRIFDEGQES